MLPPTVIETENTTRLSCERCGAILILPECLDANARREIARLRQFGHTITAIAGLRRKHDLGPGEAKAIASHIPQHPGVCHRCRGPVAEGDGVCPKCGCINLNWV